MNLLLIFFAFPIAVIIVSYILEKLLNSPVAVASLIFAIFLVVTFAAFDELFLIATLAYTLLAFITALIARYFCNRNEDENNICEKLNNILNTISNNGNNSCNCNNNDNDNDDDDDNICEAVGQILNNNNNNNNSNNCGCGCNRYRRRF